VFNVNAVTANAGPDQEFCSSGIAPVPAAMNGNTPTAPSTGLWTLISGTGTFVNPNDPQSELINMGIGTNVFQWTINNGTCGTTSDQVTYFVFNPTQSAASAGADQQLCSNANNTTLTANNIISPATGIWSLVSGTGTIVSPNSSTTQVTGLGVGTNIFQWTVDNGPCASPVSLTDQVSITVFNSAQSVRPMQVRIKLYAIQLHRLRWRRIRSYISGNGIVVCCFRVQEVLQMHLVRVTSRKWAYQLV
jgi:hypothetical protein